MSKDMSKEYKLTESDQLTLIRTTIKKTAEQLGYSDELYHLVKDSLKTLKVRIPVRMDDGSVKVFTGFRSQHNDAIGPTIGGVRFHPKVSETEINTLAIWMTLKASVLNLPLGGAMGGVICDPREMSFRELEALSRGYIRAIGPFMTMQQDILTPELFTNSQIMAWMLDEYNRMNPTVAPLLFAGKPFVLGGMQRREDARATSILAYIKQAANKKNIPLNGARIIIQGFGHAGSYIAKRLNDLGAKIIGIADAYGAIYDENGLDINYLYDRRDSFGTITKLFEQTITNQQLLELECDILVPAAVSGQITQQNAHKINAKVVVEAVNHSITLDAYEILFTRNIFLVPDILTASGDLTHSYFEWLQNKRNERFTEEEIHEKTESYVALSFQNVYKTSKNRNINTKEATYIVALQRLAEIMRFRGWI